MDRVLWRPGNSRPGERGLLQEREVGPEGKGPGAAQPERGSVCSSLTRIALRFLPSAEVRHVTLAGLRPGSGFRRGLGIGRRGAAEARKVLARFGPAGLPSAVPLRARPGGAAGGGGTCPAAAPELAGCQPGGEPSQAQKNQPGKPS